MKIRRKGKFDGSKTEENGEVVSEEETEEDMKTVEGNLLKICLALIGFGEGKVREGGGVGAECSAPF